MFARLPRYFDPSGALKRFLATFLLVCGLSLQAQLPHITVIRGDKEWPGMTGLSEVALTNVWTDSELGKDWLKMGWIAPGKPKLRSVLLFNLQLMNWGATDATFGSYDQSPKMFTVFRSQPILKCFFEVTLSTSNKIAAERYGEMAFDWDSPYTGSQPGIGAYRAVKGLSPIHGALLDVTGIKDGDYLLIVRLNPNCVEGQKWPRLWFREEGVTVPITIRKGKAFRTDLLLVRKTPRIKPEKKAPLSIIRQHQLRQAALPPMPSF